MIELQYQKTQFSELEIIDEANSIEELEESYSHLMGVEGYEICGNNFRASF